MRAWIWAMIVAVSLTATALSPPGSVASRADARKPLTSIAQSDPVLKLNERNRRRVQRALNALGFDVGEVDGRFRKRTRVAIQGYQASRGETATGRLTAGQFRALMAAAAQQKPKTNQVTSKPLNGSSPETRQTSSPEQYDPTAVHRIIQGIFDSYQPAEPLNTRPAAAKARARDDEIALELLKLPAPQPIAVDDVTVIDNPHYKATATQHADQISGGGNFQPQFRAIVSPLHRQAVNFARSSRGDNFPLNVQEAQAAAPYFERALSEFRAQYGKTHPLAGLILADLARLTTRLYTGDGQAEVAKKLARKRHLEAARLLSQPVEASELTQQVLAEHAVRNFLEAGRYSICYPSETDDAGSSWRRDEAVETYRMAAAVHHRQFGASLFQLRWLKLAATCSAELRQALRLMQTRMSLARQSGVAVALFMTYADLAITQFRLGARKAAKSSFQEAFRIYSTQVRGSGKPFDFAKLRDWSNNTYDRLLKTPADLGLDPELDMIFAATISRQITDESYTNNVGLSWIANTAFELETYGRHELADAFYAFLYAQRNGHTATARSSIPAAGVVQQMALYAEMLVNREGYDTALLFLNRAIGKVRGSKNPNETATVLGLLARTHNEKGDLDKAVEYAKRLVKLAQRFPFDQTAVDMQSINAIIATGSGTGLGTDNVAQALLDELSEGVSKVCGAAPEENLKLPSIAINRLGYDEHLARSFVGGSAILEYLNCFDQQRHRMTDFSTPWLSAVNAEHVRDILFVLSIAGDRHGAAQQLEFLFENSHWSAFKTDAELWAELPATYFKNYSPSRRLREARRSAEASRFGIIAQAIRGLILGGRETWLKPYLPVLEHTILVDTPAAAFTDSLVITELADIALSLHGLKETGLVEQLYGIIDAWKRAQTGTGWDDIRVIEFLAVMERERGNTKQVEEYLDAIPVRFTVMNSGASVDAWERNAITNMALEEGLWHERLGHFAVAEAYYELAGANLDSILKSTDPLGSIDLIRAADSLARIAYKSGKPGVARQITGHLVSAAQERIASLSTFGSDLLIRWSKRLRGVLETHLNTAKTDPDGFVDAGEQEFLAMQYLQATRTAVTFTKLSARMGRDEGSVAREHQDVSARLSGAYSRLTGANPDGSKSILRQIRSLEARSRKLEQALEQQNPAYFQHGRLQFITLEDLQRLLRPGEAVLSSYTGTDHAYLWLITREDHRLQRLELSPDELNRQVSGLRSGISADTATPDFIATQIVPVQLFHDMYRLVLGGFHADLKAVDQLIFIPHGAFDGLPISTLLTEKPPEDSMHVADVRDAKLPWLIRRMAINVMPSPGAIRVLRGASVQAPAERPFLGVGNPKFGEGLHIAAAPTRAADPRLVAMAPLPETETEVARLAEILDADAGRDLLLDTAASETTLKQTALDEYRIIAFATHGLIAGEVTGLDEPALVLSKPDRPTPHDDGLLKASEVIDLKLNADLVMLSACNTASGDGRPGAEGLSGLANAFFYAGAKNLMVTHWYIPSEAAVDITVGLMQARRDDTGLDWAQALRLAVLKLIDETGPARYANPLSWGAHMLVGVGR